VLRELLYISSSVACLLSGGAADGGCGAAGIAAPVWREGEADADADADASRAGFGLIGLCLVSGLKRSASLLSSDDARGVAPKPLRALFPPGT
jgi:hypothetical protein